MLKITSVVAQLFWEEKLVNHFNQLLGSCRRIKNIIIVGINGQE